MRGEYMMSASEVAEALGISKAHAYKIIKGLNEELNQKGFIVVAGKIPKAFWNRKFYNSSSDCTSV